MSKEKKPNQVLLRPKNFCGFVGQKKIVETLKIIIKSSIEQNKYPDHILFYGPPGLGKTTLANIIANYSKRNIVYVQGSLILVKADVLSLFATIKEGDIIFIDEIHSINKNLEELIYSVLEDNVIDVPIGPEGEKKIIRMKVNPFTLIGATTKISAISKPIKDRFGLIFKLKNYSIEELSKIIQNSGKKLDLKIEEKEAILIAKYSNETPRIANRLTKRIKDFSIYYKKEIIDEKLILKTFNNLSIFEGGLNYHHIEYLKLLNTIFDNKSASLDAISSILIEDKNTIINDIEPQLLNNNLIIKTSKGRKITLKGSQYLMKNSIV